MSDLAQKDIERETSFRPRLETKEGEKQDSVVSHIHDEILNTYPFLTPQEKLVYEDQAKDVITHTASQNTLEEVEKLLKLLHNPHAMIYPIKEFTPEKINSKRPAWKIEDNILYIKIPSWSKPLVDLDKDLIKICVDNTDKYKGIILDVRENKGGNSTYAYNFAGIFFKKDVKFGKALIKDVNDGLKELPYVLPANREIYLDNPIVVLISSECFSTNELFLAPFKISRRAVLIGEKTAGGSANPLSKEVEINGEKYCIKIPRHRFFLKGESKPLEETAITPDIPYTQDNIVDFTKRYLRNKK